MSERADEELLDRLRQWLERTRNDGDRLASNGDVPAADCTGQDPSIGLYRLLEEFTALRHDIKLQTRSVRGLEEQTETLLTDLRQVVETMQTPARPESPAVATGKGLAVALADLDEALERGRRQLEKLNDCMNQLVTSWLTTLDDLHASQSWLTRLLTRGYYQRLRRRAQTEAADAQHLALLGAFVQGYALIQQRLAGALLNEGIVRIETVGRLADPEIMIVVDVVDQPGPPGKVIDQVRPGYTWSGRLLRCAEVRTISGLRE